ncbi:MAG: Parallel beta-helix repeat protein [bacterium]|nr:Parallel beta-helix repeat protein [bacterium]
MQKRALVAVLACVAACGDGGNSDVDGGTHMTTVAGVTFPWSVFDGTVPDVATAAPPGKTWYCDAKNGDDSFDGTSFTAVSGNVGPKRTLNAILKSGAVQAGDTILLGGGIYREYPSFGMVTGKPGAPITIGSYGRGTGAPILDGGLQPNPWTKYSAQGQTTVWQTSTKGLTAITPTRPVLGIYVNDGKKEAALKEVIHGQVTPYPNNPLPPNQTQADIKDNSDHWYYDAAAGVLYADFGGTLGAGDPNQADLSILFNSLDNKQPLLVLTAGHSYFSFVGLTIRASSWNGLYSEVSGLTFDHCDIKFNGGGGISFDAGGSDVTVAHNTVVNTRIWMNVLVNYPRFNNSFTGGGWPGGLGWHNQSFALAQGNLVYGNGGEGIVDYGTPGSGGSAHLSQGNQIRNNVVFDNFSVNIYLDNTQDVTIDENFVFDHPRDIAQTFDGLFAASSGYDQDFGKRLTPSGISLADEPGSSFDGAAHLSDITVTNNIFAGVPFGFVDYDDGTQGTVHGLKNCLIANNTFVLAPQAPPGQTLYGWRHEYTGSKDASANSLVQNNIVAVAGAGSHFVEMNGAGTGIAADHNLYSGGGVWLTSDLSQTFVAWEAAHSGWDVHSLNADAMLEDPAEFTQPQKLIYDWAKARPKAGSPTLTAGTTQAKFNGDFTGARRKSWDIGALSGP